MKKPFCAVALAAALATGIGPVGAAFAQVQPTAPQAGATPLDPGETSSTSPDAGFQAVLDSIGRNAEAAAALRTMTEVGSMKVVKVAELPDADNDRLAEALSTHADGVKEMQEALQGSAALHEALVQHQVVDSQVVATEVRADGGLVVYVR